MKRSSALLTVSVVALGLLVALLAAPVAAPAATSAGPVTGFASGKCLSVLGGKAVDRARVVIEPCQNQGDDTWTLTPAGELRAFGATSCLDVRGQSVKPGAVVQNYRCNGGKNQKWRIDADGTIVGAQSNLCLAVHDAGTADATPVEMYTCTQQTNQQWRTAAGFCGISPCGVQQVATDTDIPWGLTTLPDGTVLYNRRDADQVVHLDPRTGSQTVVGTVPNVSGTNGEGGLLGLALSPSFATDHWLYLMHTSPSDNRIVRIQMVDNALVTSTEQVLLTGIARNQFHNGGRLRFGPDGKLYASTGDAQNGNNAQDKNSLNGKILRLNPDGSAPSDNPFSQSGASTAATYVWSYGHRNPQGLAFDSQGRLWEQEFGNNNLDETNLIVKGGNYGWPVCEGTAAGTGSCNGNGFVAPKQTYPVAEGSCSGLAIVHDIAYIACERGQRLYRETISGSSLTDQQVLLDGTYGRLRTVEPAPGGLWLTTSTTGDKDSTPNNSDEKIFRLALSG